MRAVLIICTVTFQEIKDTFTKRRIYLKFGRIGGIAKAKIKKEEHPKGCKGELHPCWVARARAAHSQWTVLPGRHAVQHDLHLGHWPRVLAGFPHGFMLCGAPDLSQKQLLNKIC